jgi:hypothetical protein
VEKVYKGFLNGENTAVVVIVKNTGNNYKKILRVKPVVL